MLKRISNHLVKLFKYNQNILKLKTCKKSAKMPHRNDELSSADEAPSTESVTPLTTFGIITDIQYADVDDGMNYDKTRHRYYRNSLKLVSEAVQNWRQHEIDNQCQLQFLLQLGDIIDLQAFTKNESDISLDRVLTEMNKLFPVNQSSQTQTQKILHLWGNHEMYNFPRKSLVNSVLNTAKLLGQNHLASTNCFVYEVTSKLRLICLDFYKLSLLGYEETDAEYVAALELMQAHNKNEDLNISEGLRGNALRFCKFNGGLGEQQLEWFGKQLEDCHKNGIKAIVCGHLPVHHQAAEHMCLAWDYKEVLNKMWAYEGTVLGYFAGHYHEGGYFRDKNNIHHITFHAVLETASNSNSYATVKVFEDRVSVEGVGMVGYYDIFFKTN